MPDHFSLLYNIGLSIFQHHHVPTHNLSFCKKSLHIPPPYKNARILEKGTQDNLINWTEISREITGGRSWQDHGLTWAAVKGPHYNTCLEGILAATGENGEREIIWDFHKGRKQIQNLQVRSPNKDPRTPPR